MILKNVSGQGVPLYAYIVATGLPKTGDSANITGHYSIDGGTSPPAFATANPTEISSSLMPGVYWQPMTQGSTNGNSIACSWVSTTSGVAIDPLLILTTGVNLPVAAPAASGGLITVGTGSGQITPSATGTVSVGAYAAGLDPATYILATPANKLVTDASGSVDVSSIRGTPSFPTDGTLASATSTTVTFPTTDSGARAIPDDARYEYTSLVILDGTGVGQNIMLTTKTGVRTFGVLSGTMLVQCDNTSKYAIGPAWRSRLDLTQAIPASNTGQTVGDALNAARAQGFGKWVLSGTTLTLYASDGTTSVRAFTLDSATAPTQRT